MSGGVNKNIQIEKTTTDRKTENLSIHWHMEMKESIRVVQTLRIRH